MRSCVDIGGASAGGGIRRRGRVANVRTGLGASVGLCCSIGVIHSWGWGVLALVGRREGICCILGTILGGLAASYGFVVVCYGVFDFVHEVRHRRYDD
jgi:hypothetical protein